MKTCQEFGMLDTPPRDGPFPVVITPRPLQLYQALFIQQRFENSDHTQGEALGRRVTG